VVYNNADSNRELKIPLGDTPLDGATQLDSLLGNLSADVRANEARITLPARALAAFKVR